MGDGLLQLSGAHAGEGAAGAHGPREGHAFNQSGGGGDTVPYDHASSSSSSSSQGPALIGQHEAASGHEGRPSGRRRHGVGRTIARERDKATGSEQGPRGGHHCIYSIPCGVPVDTPPQKIHVIGLYPRGDPD